MRLSMALCSCYHCGRDRLTKNRSDSQAVQQDMEEIQWDDFTRVHLCAGTIIDVQEFPEARRPAWKLTVDFGPVIGQRRSSAQITDLYDRESLMGLQVMAVVNFPKKQIGPFMSECLVTGMAREDGAIVLVTPMEPVPDGTRLT